MADITILTAHIGGGKSLYATRQICEELRRSERMIVTNVPIFLEDAPEGYITLGEWCHKYVERPVDLKKRFRLLTDEEVWEFWRYLPGRKLDEVERSMPKGEVEKVPDLASRQGDGGCLYAIDEAHLRFGARDWQRTGTAIQFYMSQLRKLNDDIYLISQNPGKLDKNFRRDATEWIVMQNMAKKSLFA